MKTCHAPGCSVRFESRRPFEVWCSPEHGAIIAKQRVEKARAKAAKVDRASTRAALEKLKTRSDWLREAQTVVNRYVRLKALSRGESCYTCGATPDRKFGGTYDASHFRSVGSAPHLRFWIPQIRLACVVCNRHKGGAILQFRQALVREHGEAWVHDLESRQEVAKFTVDYLQRLKKVFNKRNIRLAKKLHSIHDDY